jgi:ADP-ribose pyrophosphatase YjhB (NUDIX family)
VISSDSVGAGDRWIPQAEYEFIRARVPILCVDFVPLSREQRPRVGLIRRQTYEGHEGWCLVGGAVLRDEPLPDAIDRHFRATLGDEAQIDANTLHFLDIIEYFTKPGMGEFYDPRKHSVALTYFGRCGGPIRPCGEALEFRWFQLEDLPGLQFGFGQEKVLARLIKHAALTEQ